MLSANPDTLIPSLFDARLVAGNANLDTSRLENFIGVAQIPLLDVNLVQALINSKHLDVNSRCTTPHEHLRGLEFGCTLLNYAVMWAHFELIEMLMDNGANVNLGNINHYGNTPLRTALERRNYSQTWPSDLRIRLIRALNSKGKLAIPTTIDQDFHPVLEAYERGWNVFEEVLSMGVNIDETIPLTHIIGEPDDASKLSDMTLFMYGVVIGDYHLARAMKQRGADTQKTAIFNFYPYGPIMHLSPLEYAVECQSRMNLQSLLEIGVDINAVDREGRTALWKCASIRNPRFTPKCLTLIEHGADVSKRCGMALGNTTPLEIADGLRRDAMLQALERRRAVHVWGLYRQNTTIPNEMIRHILKENGL